MSEPSQFETCGLSKSYEDIAVNACKRGRNGEGVGLQVDVETEDGKLLGIAFLTGEDRQRIVDVVDLPAVDQPAEYLHRNIANVLSSRLLQQRQDSIQAIIALEY